MKVGKASDESIVKVSFKKVAQDVLSLLSWKYAQVELSYFAESMKVKQILFSRK